MAGPASTSSNSSHTLTNAPGMSVMSTFDSKPSGAANMLALFEAIKSGNRHTFLQPSPSISDASLQLAKTILDAYAGQISDEQQQRLKEANKKRKRAHEAPRRSDVLKIRKLYVDGFESGQVWQQAKRIISSALQDSKNALEDLEENDELEVNRMNGDAKPLGSEDDSSDMTSDGEDEEASPEDATDSEDDLEVGEEDELSEEGEDVDEEEFEGLKADFGGDLEDDDDNGEEKDDEEPSEDFVEDPNGLNDGFFSIDTFNKQTQFFEDQDAKANPNTDMASDDEEINWHTDPLAERPAVNGKSKKKGEVEDMPSDIEDDDDEEGGPTFGSMELDAPEGESEDELDEEMDGEMDEFNANDVFYKDFFAPPPTKGSKNGKPRKPRTFKPVEPDENDMERAMADVRRDLFDDESEHEESEDALSDVDAGDPKSRKSAHERRQAKLAEEIRQLESQNVAEKKWTLTGEARAGDRPKHSLLDEELDFEHIGKPVIVVTPEVSESIEEMIKRRILAQEFDEVLRRRPDSLDQSNTRRGLVDLEDTKAKQSLAELYEEDHVKNSNPDSHVSKSDEKLRKDEQEIEQMWKAVSAKLDALSSWHYKPKPAAPSLTVVADVATISMEDAQPTTAQGVSGGDNTLAPQEIYKAGKDTAEKGEVIAKSGLPIARQELSREDKTRRRRREKERIRKAGGIGEKKLGAKAQARKDTLSDLKKGGVKVINKKGEVLDMEGNKAKAAKAASSRNFKL